MEDTGHEKIRTLLLVSFTWGRKIVQCFKSLESISVKSYYSFVTK